jgi:phosphate transport system substrate-binding protein
VKINYTPVGSGAGVRQFLDQETDFGCTDAALTTDQLKKAGPVLHIPLVLGGVVPAYHLPEVTEPLRLSGPVLADIFLGNIKMWNDPAIQELNPGANLPGQPISVLYRSDRSGTTAIFTNYLAVVHPAWKKGLGSGTAVQFPVGEGHKGNEELARAISQTPGGIGYVDLIHALRTRIQQARVKNREGNFVQGSLEGVTAAGEGALTAIPDDLRFSLSNAPGKDAYPISGATWAIVYVKQSKDRGQRLVDFLSWVTTDGQESVTDLYYARLPKGLAEKTTEKLKQVQIGK